MKFKSVIFLSAHLLTMAIFGAEDNTQDGFKNSVSIIELSREEKNRIGEILGNFKEMCIDNIITIQSNDRSRKKRSRSYYGFEINGFNIWVVNFSRLKTREQNINDCTYLLLTFKNKFPDQMYKL